MRKPARMLHLAVALAMVLPELSGCGQNPVNTGVSPRTASGSPCLGTRVVYVSNLGFHDLDVYLVSPTTSSLVRTIKPGHSDRFEVPPTASFLNVRSSSIDRDEAAPKYHERYVCEEIPVSW